jgi:hypothetical protein
MARSLAACAFAALICLPPALTAQTLRPSVSLGSGLVPVDPAASGGALLLAPRLDLVTRSIAFRAEGRFAWTALTAAGADVAVSAVIPGLHTGRFRFSGDVAGHATRFALGGAHGRALATGRAEFWSGDASAFAMLAAGGASNGPSSGALLRAGAGARSRRGRATFELAITSTRYAAGLALGAESTVIDTTFVNRQRRLLEGAAIEYTQADVRFGWRGPDWRLAIEAGGRLDDALHSRGAWAQAHAQKRIAAGIDVLASGGWAPSLPELRLESRPIASISLRFAPAREAASARPATNDDAVTHVLSLRGNTRRILIPHTGAHRVEIMADFTDWKAVGLRNNGDGWWTVELNIAPGHYNMNVRFDGGPWRVPAGLAPIRDDFDGWTGAIFIE